MQWFTFDSPKCCCCVLVNRFVSYSEIFLTVCPLIVLFRLLIKSTAFCKHHFAKTVRYTLIQSVLAISFHLPFCFVLLSSTQGRTVVLFVDTVIQSDSWTGGITTQERSVRARYTHAHTTTLTHSHTHTHTHTPWHPHKSDWKTTTKNKKLSLVSNPMFTFRNFTGSVHFIVNLDCPTFVTRVRHWLCSIWCFSCIICISFLNSVLCLFGFTLFFGNTEQKKYIRHLPELSTLFSAHKGRFNRLTNSPCGSGSGFIHCRDHFCSGTGSAQCK